MAFQPSGSPFVSAVKSGLPSIGSGAAAGGELAAAAMGDAALAGAGDAALAAFNFLRQSPARGCHAHLAVSTTRDCARVRMRAAMGPPWHEFSAEGFSFPTFGIMILSPKSSSNAQDFLGTRHELVLHWAAHLEVGILFRCGAFS